MDSELTGMSNGSKDDNREELPWEEREENLIKKIAVKCEDFIAKHDRCAKHHKTMFVVFGLPAMLIPIVLAGINPFIKNRFELLMSGLLVCSGVLTGISQFFNFGKKTQAHLEYIGRYSELLLMIEVELVKPKRFRIPCDVFLERVSKQFGDLNANAPT